MDLKPKENMKNNSTINGQNTQTKNGYNVGAGTKNENGTISFSWDFLKGTVVKSVTAAWEKGVTQEKLSVANENGKTTLSITVNPTDRKNTSKPGVGRYGVTTTTPEGQTKKYDVVLLLNEEGEPAAADRAVKTKTNFDMLENSFVNNTTEYVELENEVVEAALTTA